MNMAHIGIGIGAFADGIVGGMEAGRKIKKVRQENEIERVRKEGLEGVKQERESQISSRIKPIQAAADGIVTNSFQVGDQTFENQEDARKAAETGIESVSEMFLKNVGPKIQETYLLQGDVEKAEYWRQFSEDRRGKDYMKSWTKAFMLGQAGDFDQSAKTMGGLLNSLDLGMTYQGHEVTKDGEGNATGFTMKVKDGETGKVTEMPMTLESYMEFVQMNNPQAFAESMYQQQQQANSTRLDDAKDERKYNREQSGRIELETLKAELAQTSQGKAPADVQAAEWLIDNGVARSPREAWRLAKSAITMGREKFAMDYAQMVKSGEDPLLGETVSAEDALNQGLAFYDRLAAEAEASQAPAAPNPASPAGQAVRGVPVLDTKTGTVIYR